jgi:hypothetical protein
MTTKLVPLTIGSSGVSGKTVPLGWIVVPVLSEVRESGVYVTFSCEIQATKSSCSEERKASVRTDTQRDHKPSPLLTGVSVPLTMTWAPTAAVWL